MSVGESSEIAPGHDDGKDAALSEDIRLLGRLLGDVVRAQAGDEVFELVETVRRRAVDARRGGRDPCARWKRRRRSWCTSSAVLASSESQPNARMRCS